MIPKSQINKFIEDLRDDNLTGVAYKNLLLKKKILTHFAHSGNTTINELSKELNISSPKISKMIGELMSDGLVQDYGKIEAGVGRRPNNFGLTNDSVFFVGVEVKKSYINIGITDLNNKLIKFTPGLPYQLSNTEKSLDQLCQLINNYLDKQGIDRKKYLGMGVNLTGRINFRTGYSYSYFYFNEEPLSKVIKARTGISTFLENDSRAMAFGEFTCGGVQDEKDVLFINIDYGIGMGIMINGELYYGKSGFSGEFGHIPFFENEIICHCGKKGCLETEVSGRALIRTFQEKLREGSASRVQGKFSDPEKIELENIIQAAVNDDTLAIELIDELGLKLGKALTSLIHLYNPDLIILGGSLADTGDYLYLPVKMAINKYSLNLISQDTKIKLSSLGIKAGIMGACLLAREKFLKNIY
ncbi:ROK family transcriptional regulator [Negadavirga shengliensis]|uniref:ROK family protein n=1 Tax=Negadavirga shengliensis TaxID=1389218 RepID=A0ABV9T1G5_9BACT